MYLGFKETSDSLLPVCSLVLKCRLVCRNSSRPAEVDLRWKAAGRRTHAVRLQHPEGEKRVLDVKEHLSLINRRAADESLFVSPSGIYSALGAQAARWCEEEEEEVVHDPEEEQAQEEEGQTRCAQILQGTNCSI